MNGPLKYVFVLISISCFHAYGQQHNTALSWMDKVGARSRPSAVRVFNVKDYGAVGDGSTLSSPAIQKAIDACSDQGGGVVVFSPGIYLTGAVFLKDNVHLRIDKGVLLLGSQDINDYPEIATRVAGIEMNWPAALINIIGRRNVMVSGEGQINANGKFCWDKYWALRKEYDAKGLRWAADYDAKRVRTILVQRCSDVSVSGLTISNAGFWTVQVLYSSYVTVDGLVIRNNVDGKGPSTDGIDIDSSSWILVQHCDVDGNDDNFCLKSGRDWDGLRVNKPTEYVVIRNCIARRGSGLLTLGSETSGGIRHVMATGLKAIGTSNGFRMKSARTRGGVVEDIYFINAVMDSVGCAFQFMMEWNPSYSHSSLPEGYDTSKVPAYWLALLRPPVPAEKGIPVFRNIHIRDVKVTHARKMIAAEGMADGASFLTGFRLNNISATAGTAGNINFAKDWKSKDVIISTNDGSAVKIKNSENVSLQ